MGEIDDWYKDSVEVLDQSFIDKLNSGTDLKLLEQEYLVNLKKLRDKFNKDYTNYLANQRKQIRPKSLSDKKENFPIFKSESVSLEFSAKERSKIKREIKIFVFKRKVKNFFYKITPSRLVFWYFRILHTSRGAKSTIDDFESRKINQFKDGLEKTKELAIGNSTKFLLKTSTFLKLVLVKIKLFLSDLISRFKKKNEEKPISAQEEPKKEEPIKEKIETSQNTES